MALSPDLCVIGFFEALGRQDLPAARRFVFRAKNSEQVDSVHRCHPEVKVGIESVSISQETALVTFKAGGEGQLGEKLVAFCRLIEGSWRLDTCPKELKRYRSEFDQTVEMFQVRKPFAFLMDRWKEQANVEVCLSNVGMVGHALMQAVLATELDPAILTREELEQMVREGKKRPLNPSVAFFKISRENWQAEISSYLPESTQNFFECPLGGPISFNTALSRRLLAEVTQPHRTVLSYEGSNDELAFRHGGKAHVSFVLGSNRAVNKSEAKELIWNLS